MINPLLKVAQYMYFQEKLEEYNNISYSGMLPNKNKVDFACCRRLSRVFGGHSLRKP